MKSTRTPRKRPQAKQDGRAVPRCPFRGERRQRRKAESGRARGASLSVRLAARQARQSLRVDVTGGPVPPRPKVRSRAHGSMSTTLDALAQHGMTEKSAYLSGRARRQCGLRHRRPPLLWLLSYAGPYTRLRPTPSKPAWRGSCLAVATASETIFDMVYCYVGKAARLLECRSDRRISDRLYACASSSRVIAAARTNTFTSVAFSKARTAAGPVVVALAMKHQNRDQSPVAMASHLG